MKTTLNSKWAVVSSMLLAASSAMAGGVSTTAFTYQGRLEDNGVPANDDYAFVVRLFDDVAAGTQLGPTICEDAVDVENGLFTLLLDFGAEFNSGQRFLDIQVLRKGDCLDMSGSTQLFPRQPITATPMALRALEAEVAERAGLAEHAGFADLATAAHRLDAPDGSPSAAVFVDNDGNVGFGNVFVRRSGQIGVGAGVGVPEVPLHVVAQGADAEPGSGGFIQTGFTDFENVVLDNNEIMARNNGAPSTLFLNDDGGNVSISGSNAAGRVGIGTASPLSVLDIRGGENGGAGTAATLRLQGSNAAQVMLFDGNEIDAFADGLFINNNTTQPIVLANGGGNVGIGDTTPDTKLDVVGDITYTGIITDVSDERLKENIAPVRSALEIVQQLHGVYFNMKDTPGEREVGLLAQNVQRVLPEAVRIIDSDNGYLGVSYASLVPILVEAIKETQDQMTSCNPAGTHAAGALQEPNADARNMTFEVEDFIERERSWNCRLAELEGRNADLQARVARLEALLESRSSPQPAN